MARIRSIKPEFWTSEQIAECSPNARLLFIGMWSFCDDYGVHPASLARLKMEVFPADAISTDDVRRMVAELTSNGLLAEYEIDGTRYWYVTGARQAPPFRAGKDSADGVAVLAFASQCGVCCCSMYWRTMYD